MFFLFEVNVLDFMFGQL